MKTLDLSKREVTVEELLTWARSESVLILAKDGREFVVEEADDFSKEAAMLGSSLKFTQFLEERSKQSGGIPLEEIERRLSH